MIEEDQTQRGRETKENQSNLHIIKCQEQKSEWVSSNEIMNAIRISNFGLIDIKSVVINVIEIIIAIASFLTKIKNNKTYKYIKEFLITNPDTIISPTYADFWMNIGKNEDQILIPYLVFIVLLLFLNLFFYLKNSNKIHLEINQGVFYYLLLIITLLFMTIQYFLGFCVLYLFVSSLLVAIKTPFDFFVYKDMLSEIKDEWKKNRIVPFIHVALNFLEFILNIIMFYLFQKNLNSYFEMNFEEKEKIKTGKLLINDLNLDIKIKSKNLYLLHSDENRENFYEIAKMETHFLVNKNLSNQNNKNQLVKCLAFKKALIKDYINCYIYMNLEYRAIRDQLPLVNEGYSFLTNIYICSISILFILLISSSKLHVANEALYDLLIVLYEETKPKFFGIFKIYGNFEKKATKIRIIYLIIEACLLFILYVVRLIQGGFKNIIFIRISIVFSIFLALLHFIDMILSFLIILFSIFFFRTTEGELLANFTVIPHKLIFQIVSNFFWFCLDKCLLVFSVKSAVYYSEIIKERKKLKENMVGTDLNKEIVFEYIDLNNNQKKLNEFRIKGLPKFLFYELEGDNQGNDNETQNKIIATVIEVNNTDNTDNNKMANDNSHRRIKNK